jgi:hypothetical protein
LRAPVRLEKADPARKREPAASSSRIVSDEDPLTRRYQAKMAKSESLSGFTVKTPLSIVLRPRSDLRRVPIAPLPTPTMIDLFTFLM